MAYTVLQNQVRFSDSDVVNLSDWIPDGEYNPHKNRPYLLHNHGFVLCVVFADSLQDAINAAVDADKLDRFLIDPTDEDDRKDYMTTDVTKAAVASDAPDYVAEDGTKYWWRVEPAFLGNQ